MEGFQLGIVEDRYGELEAGDGLGHLFHLAPGLEAGTVNCDYLNRGTELVLQCLKLAEEHDGCVTADRPKRQDGGNTVKVLPTVCWCVDPNRSDGGGCDGCHEFLSALFSSSSVIK